MAPLATPIIYSLANIFMVLEIGGGGNMFWGWDRIKIFTEVFEDWSQEKLNVENVNGNLLTEDGLRIIQNVSK